MFHKIIPVILAASYALAAGSAHLSEAKVFEWWDDGIVDGNEAREILGLLEEGNVEEACLLAEVYALESCDDDTPKKDNAGQAKSTKKQRTTRKKADKKTGKAKDDRPGIAPHGYIEWRDRTDSLGHLESHRTEVRMNFYRYSLRLGTQSLLTYRNAGSEAHFGQVSTRELHSGIPIDTLWGAASLYPLGMFRLGALLDTAATTRLSLGIATGETELQLAYWHHQHPSDSTERHSVAAQASGSWGNVAAWWVPENGAALPLLKLQLKLREKTEYATLAWKADAYAHGHALPEESHLAPTIASSRFWGSQTASTAFFDPWKSKLTMSARTVIPLEGDTSKTRFKAKAESGPSVTRGSASVTCISAEGRCRQNDLSFRLRSAWDIAESRAVRDRVARDQLAFSGRIRARHTRGAGFGPPLYEAGAAYTFDTFNSASVTVSVPKGAPAREIQFRSAAEVGTGYLQLSLSVTFRRTAETPLHPLHATLKAKMSF